ncbi:MAG: IS4 family transposase [Nevskia sp.]|nr:IS4 family transposase [Nevskia sp.]
MGAIRDAGFGCVAQQAQSAERLLAVEDTTSASYAHAAAARLGGTGSQREARHRGYLVHSVLLLDATREHTLGLIEQRHWCRDDAEYGKKHARKQRAYEDKESYQWEQASVRMAARLGEAMARTISVCDRESDVYEYLSYKQQQGHRFILRAQSDRGVSQAEQTLFATLTQEAQALCCYTVDIAQRAGRRARQAKLLLRSLRVELQPPANRSRKGAPLTVNVVLAQEIDPVPGEDALRWILLTTEPVSSAEHALQVVRYYELRWRIEEYHKAWKSGVGVERQRFQSPENLERMLVITAFLAVRLLQLREHVDAPVESESARSCDTVLTQEQWRVLWHSSERHPLPDTPPSLRWACLAIAKLGGFANTKRTGRPGWDTLWHGWARLQKRVEGYQIAKQMAKQM